MVQRTYLFKSTVNNILDSIANSLSNNTSVLNDIALAKFFNVSRSTVREAVSYLLDEEIIQRSGRDKIILRAPEEVDYFTLDVKDLTKEKQIEVFFLNLLMSGELMPGDKFSELDLAQKSGCTTITVREFLNRFSSYPLIEKIPRSGWKVVELNEHIIRELTAFREMIELRSLTDLLQLSEDNPVWNTLSNILAQHQQLKNNFDSCYKDFTELDKRLHFTILNASDNRYVNKFYSIIFFTCNYYFLCGQQDKEELVRAAIDEHIEMLTHMLSYNYADSILSMKAHINSTQKNLLNCVKNLEMLSSNRSLV
jgi:DNA-binding GntR family transcriptional regulator